MKPTRMPTAFLPEGFTKETMARRLQQLGFELDWGDGDGMTAKEMDECDIKPGVLLPWDPDGFYFLTENLKRSMTFDLLYESRYPDDYPKRDSEGLLAEDLFGYLRTTILHMDRVATAELARALRASGRIDGWLYAGAIWNGDCAEVVERAEVACKHMTEWKPIKAWLEAKRNLAVIFTRMTATNGLCEKPSKDAVLIRSTDYARDRPKIKKEE